MPKIGENTQWNSKWLRLLRGIREAINQDKPPESAEGQEFAQRWSALVSEMYDGDWKLASKVWDLQRHKTANLGLVSIDEKIIHFIEAAIEHAWSESGYANE